MVFSAPLCRAEVGFDIKELKRIASRDKNKRGEDPWFRLPGTNIKAGAFTYIFIPDPPLHEDKPGEEDWTMKAALLVNNSMVYFVQSENVSETKNFGDFDIGGGCHFGTYKNYFLMDCINFMANGSNQRMFLFRYGKDKIELLDVIVVASFKIGSKTNLLEFMSETVGDVKRAPNELLNSEIPIPAMIEEFRDIDNDKAPEVLL